MRCLPLALCLVLAGSAARGWAQEEFVEPFPAEMADEIVTEPGAFMHGVSSVCDACNWPTYGMYVKSGPAFLLGDGYFSDSSRVGYQVAIGAREAISPSDRKFFFDLGGSYLSAFGTEAPFAVSGAFRRVTLNPITGQPQIGRLEQLDDLMSLSLREMSRTSAQAALGWYFDVVDCQTCTCRFAGRFGGRLSHVRGHFKAEPSDELLGIINDPDTLAIINLAKDETFSETDTSAGIFGGVEMAIDRQVSRTARLSFLVDAEFANDWVELKNYAKRGLPTASVMFGLSLSR